jgi:hypothetical protein
MNTISRQTSRDLLDGAGYEATVPDASQSLVSPFAQHELFATTAEADAGYQSRFETSSPFSESYTTDDGVAMEEELTEMLLAELGDEEFTEALEALATEASGRYMSGAAGWHHEAGVPVIDPTDVEQWTESVGMQADQLLDELEQRFRDRSVESVTDEELDAAMARSFPQLEAFTDPLDAQEMFFGSLKNKLKKIANSAKNVVKKGIKLASKIMPLGIIFGRLRPIIKPLLKKVLAKAIGKLPRSLREPARRLAQKFGLQQASEFETEFEYFAAEFDMQVAEAITNSDAYALEALEAEALQEQMADTQEPNIAEQLDIARERLVQQLLETDPGDSPIAAMEQFIPLAIMPIVKTGIKLVGRKRIVSVVAGLLAKLIQPVVGRQLANPLSLQIADKGLALLSLEAEAESGRLGAEAIVAATEETIADVFSMPDELLESELLLEAAVQDAFHRAVARHIPGAFLRHDVVDSEHESERGVWVMMPRVTSPLYRYQKYSRAIPVRVPRAMARGVVFSDGETLEERLADEGVTTWPVEVEIEAYQLLPGSDVGHLTPFEMDGQSGSHHDAAMEFDTLDDAGELPLPPDMERSARRRPRPGHNRRLIRVRAGGRGLRRKSPVSVRLDLGGARPAIRLHVWVGERRAHTMVDHLQKQQHREIVAAFKAITGDPMRLVVTRRLSAMLRRHKLPGDEAAITALTNQLFDGLLGSLANQLPGLAGTLATAAKNPARGLTVTATFTFPSKDAIGKGTVGSPTLTVHPGRHRG